MSPLRVGPDVHLARKLSLVKMGNIWTAFPLGKEVASGDRCPARLNQRDRLLHFLISQAWLDWALIYPGLADLKDVTTSCLYFGLTGRRTGGDNRHKQQMLTGGVNLPAGPIRAPSQRVIEGLKANYMYVVPPYPGIRSDRSQSLWGFLPSEMAIFFWWSVWST